MILIITLAVLFLVFDCLAEYHGKRRHKGLETVFLILSGSCLGSIVVIVLFLVQGYYQ